MPLKISGVDSLTSERTTHFLHMKCEPGNTINGHISPKGKCWEC